jgi:hypothetical protein
MTRVGGSWPFSANRAVGQCPASEMSLRTVSSW